MAVLQFFLPLDLVLMASYLVVVAKHGDNCMSVDPNMTTV